MFPSYGKLVRLGNNLNSFLLRNVIEVVDKLLAFYNVLYISFVNIRRHIFHCGFPVHYLVKMLKM